MLGNLLSVEAFHFMLTFCRIGAAFMVLPIFSASFVNVTLRLALALAITALIYPNVVSSFPPEPTNVLELFFLFVCEIIIGIFLGLIPVFLLTALDLAGSNIGISLGFSNASMFDPANSSQSMLTNTFLSYVAILMILSLNLHYLVITAIFDSYSLFVPGKGLQIGDITYFLSNTLVASFKIGFEISAPFVVFSIILNVGMGILSRLMPQLNVLFLVMPMQSFFGLALLMMVLPTVMICALGYLEDGLISFLKVK